MGNNSAKIDSTSFGSIGEDSTVHKQASLWRQPLSLEEARRKYFLGMKTAEVTEQASLVEFRALLDDPVAIKYFFDYARKVGKFYLIKCWKDIQANKFLASLHDSRVSGNLSAGSLPESVFTHIFSNDDSTELFEESSKLMQEAREYENRRDIPLHLLEELCFELLFRKIYVDFLKTDAFNDMCNQLRESYNLVHENDFEYYDKISEGAYGLVVHVKKMSTGKHYAMKIQHKALLLRHYKEDTHRMLQEMQAVACCNHPFIIGLAYAFQTPSLALMTLPLCIYGDLGILIMNSPCKRIPLPHVVFYVAEIVSALCYLHDCGLIYRDLKPANVLLNGDGHILLADFGAVADVEGIINRCIDQSATTYSNSLAVDGKKNGTDVRKTATKGDDAPSDENDKAVAARLPLFKVYKSIEQQQQDQVRQKRGSNIEPMSSEDTANRAAPSGVDATNVESTEGEKGKSENSETGTSGSHLTASTAPNAPVSDALPGDDGLGPPIGDRAKSIVGTIAYMAPEIILKFGSPEYGDITYTKAVDYWSLGVTTYAMIYGRLPFRQVKLDRLQEQLRVSLTKRKRIPYDVVFRQIFGKVTYAGIDNFGGYSYDSNASDYCGSFTLNQMQENEIIIGSFIDTLIEFNPANRGTNTGHDIPLPSANNSRHRMHNVPGAENENGNVAAGACTGNNEAFSKTTSKNSDGGGSSEPPSAETASSTSIKNHIFFRGIDFSLLDCKGITPPPIPSQIVASMRAKYSSSGLAVTGEFGNFGDSTSHVSGDSNAPASTDSTFRKGDIEPTPPPTKSGGISLIAPAITATSNNSCNGATGLSMTTGSGGSVKHFAKEHVHDGVQQGPRRTIADVLMRNNRTNWVPQSALGNAVLSPIDERSKSKSKTPVDAMQNRHGVATGFPRSAVDDGRVPSSWLRGLCSSAKDVAAYTPNAPHQRRGMTAPKLSAPVPASQAKNLREEDDMFTVKQVDQQHFANWYYVSPAVIDQEYNAQRLLSAPGNMGGNSQV